LLNHHDAETVVGAPDQLDRELAETGVEMIAPHRTNRTQMDASCAAIATDGRSSGCFAWLQDYRRLVTR
jgi:hypothetical protein